MPPRPRQAGDPAAADWIDDRYEYDRRGAARLLQRPNGCTGGGQDDLRRDGNQFCRVANAVGISRPQAQETASTLALRFLDPCRYCARRPLLVPILYRS